MANNATNPSSHRTPSMRGFGGWIALVIGVLLLCALAAIVVWQGPNINDELTWPRIANAASDGQGELIPIVAWATIASLLIALLALWLTFLIYKNTSKTDERRAAEIGDQISEVLNHVKGIVPAAGTVGDREAARELLNRLVPAKRREKGQADVPLQHVEELPLGELTRLVRTWEQEGKTGDWSVTDVRAVAKCVAGKSTSWYFVFGKAPNAVYALTRGGRGRKGMSNVEKWEE